MTAPVAPFVTEVRRNREFSPSASPGNFVTTAGRWKAEMPSRPVIVFQSPQSLQEPIAFARFMAINGELFDRFTGRRHVFGSPLFGVTKDNTDMLGTGKAVCLELSETTVAPSRGDLVGGGHAAIRLGTWDDMALRHRPGLVRGEQTRVIRDSTARCGCAAGRPPDSIASRVSVQTGGQAFAGFWVAPIDDLVEARRAAVLVRLEP
jgi:hypothetical protein